jgi:hypothetical protein
MVFLCHLDLDKMESLLQTIEGYLAPDYEYMDADECVYLLVDELAYAEVIDRRDEDFKEGWKEAIRFRRETTGPDYWFDVIDRITQAPFI